MKSIKIIFICLIVLFFQNGYSQNENLGNETRKSFKQQVGNKFVEIIISSRPGEFLAGKTFFHFKLEKIIIHKWEIDGVLYDSKNSNGVLPAMGKLGHIYANVRIKTVNNHPNEYWGKNGFQINKQTDFQDIVYDGPKNKWLPYAYLWQCDINSVHVSDWFAIQKRIKSKVKGQNKATTYNEKIPVAKYSNIIIGNWKRIAQIQNGKETFDCNSSFSFSNSQITNQYYLGDNCDKLKTQTDPYSVINSNLNIYTDCCGTMTWSVNIPNKNTLELTYDNITDIFKRQ